MSARAACDPLHRYLIDGKTDLARQRLKVLRTQLKAQQPVQEVHSVPTDTTNVGCVSASNIVRSVLDVAVVTNSELNTAAHRCSGLCTGLRDGANILDITDLAPAVRATHNLRSAVLMQMCSLYATLGTHAKVLLQAVRRLDDSSTREFERTLSHFAATPGSGA